ncbi:type II toxin-antitoxin system RelE/ParE family toxin [Caenimonas sp. DR4.4]|uniref:Type II toxin-antitoxin system RelE/ParE family toxin n=1 Tax=Caenimonas aquaedulcis TaxID=2793270 RepID=A0A931MG48_9BURK|nr:type II toxin-antitoxin system RelE/ParE family toxin [Caenimonas aquaedulcis]
MSLDDAFEPEFEKFTDDEKDWLLTAAKALGIAGPQVGRPHVDTLKASKHQNMKELRYKSDDGSQIWRAAFAFDPNQQAIILCAADKQGVSPDGFYRSLIAKADKRYDSHLKRIRDGRERAGAARKGGAKVQAKSSKRK